MFSRVFVLGIAFVGSCFSVSAQSADAGSPLKLKVTGHTVIAGQAPTITYRTNRCDSDGNVYIPMYLGPEDPKPFVKVDSHGVVQQRFNTNYQDAASPADFTIDPSGTVFELYRDSKGNPTIAKFNSKGNVDSKIVLGEQFFPEGEFGVFKSGAIFVAVSEIKDRKRPFSAIFDVNGKLLKKITFEDDASVLDAINNHNESFVPSNQHYDSNAAIAFGTVTAGSDGNMYVLRHTVPAIIYAVSPSGEVVRRLKVDSGEPSLLPTALFERDGQLAVEFTRWSPVGDISSRIVVVSGSTGEVVNKFDADDSIGTTMLCFEPSNQFKFLGHAGKELLMKEVQP